MKLTKAQLNFLRKIEAGKVFRIAGYTKRRGGYTRFVGGEAMFIAVQRLGLATIGVPQMGIKALAELTDAGRRALAEQEERK